MDDKTTQTNFKLQIWREKKYRKTTNKMGRWFLGGRNRPRGLSLIVDNGTLPYYGRLEIQDSWSLPCFAFDTNLLLRKWFCNHKKKFSTKKFLVGTYFWGNYFVNHKMFSNQKIVDENFWCKPVFEEMI